MNNINHTKWFVGGALILVGIGFLLERLIPDFNFGRLVGMFWPIIFVFIGVSSLIRSPKNPLFGIIFTALGFGFFIEQFTDVNIWQLWPLILIAIGISVLTGKTNNMETHVSSEDTLHESVVFWGIDKRIKSEKFSGGSVNVVFGGAEIDLRNVKIAPEGANLEVNAAFGGIEILVPEDMHIKSSGAGIFGGFENKAGHTQNTQGAVLHITGSAIFGGIEIKQKRK